MGEAAKLLDDVAVHLCKAQDLAIAGLGAEGLDEAHAVDLVLQLLGMLQGHVDEVAQLGLDLQVEAPAQGQAHDPPGLAVGGEGVGAVPEQVARELVEQEDQGQGRLGLQRPVIVLPASGGEVQAKSRRAVYFAAQGRRIDTPVYVRDTLPIGGRITGPAVIQEFGATTVIAPGDRLEVGELGEFNIELAL